VFHVAVLLRLDPAPSRRILKLRIVVCIISVQGIEPGTITSTSESSSSSLDADEIRPPRFSSGFPSTHAFLQ
jgi:hypothetical protein